jgi:hypothetical protein
MALIVPGVWKTNTIAQIRLDDRKPKQPVTTAMWATAAMPTYDRDGRLTERSCSMTGSPADDKYRHCWLPGQCGWASVQAGLLPGICGLWLFAAFLLVLAASVGCTSLKLPSDPWPWSKEKPGVPVRMTDMWTYAVLNQPGQPGVRGFGGRVMFYGTDSEKPIKVDGTLTVFAFDAAETDPSRAKPLRKFVFPAENLESHYSKSKLGHSYSFWLPWDEVGGPEQQISLIARFESRTGETLVGSPSRQTLPGPGSANQQGQARRQDNPAAREHPPVQAASHEEPASSVSAGRSITTMTIDVPPGFVQRNAFAGQAVAGGQAEVGQCNASQSIARGPCSEMPQQSNGEAVTGAASAASWSEAQPAERSTRFSPGRFPARRGSIAAPRSDPVRRQPYPATWPSALPATPRWGWSGAGADMSATGWSVAPAPAAQPATAHQSPP